MNIKTLLATLLITFTLSVNAGERLLVTPNNGVSHTRFEEIVKLNNSKIISKIDKLNIYVVESEDDSLKHNPNIKHIEKDKLIPPDIVNDPYYTSAWHLQNIQAEGAWNYSLGSGIVVAILDSGVNTNHPDLIGRSVPGRNIYDGNDDTSDVQGHGTKVAGVVAASSNNGIGVTSVAGQAFIMPVRISQLDGWAYWSTIANGVIWAADNGAKVANISYAAHSSSTIQSASQYMRDRGGIVVNSAGNSGALDATLNTPSMITVSATDSSNNRAGWSSYGSYVDLAAPGVGIWTTNRDGGYSAVSGTSFSSPITAGVVALMMAANTILNPDQIEDILKATSTDLGDTGVDIYYGFGLINATLALERTVKVYHQTPDTTFPTINIIRPLDGSTVTIVKGKTSVPIEVNSSDNIAISNLTLYIDNKIVVTGNSSSIQYNWNIRKVSNGVHYIKATATDSSNNTTVTQIQITKQ